MCPHCKTEIPDGTFFCLSCGKTLNAEAERIRRLSEERRRKKR